MLDHSFVDWALGLPSAVNRRGSEGKILLKRAFSRLVPPNVLKRPKQGFSVPLARWFRGTMGRHLDQKLGSKAGLASSDYLDSSTIQRLIAEHQGGWADNSRALWLIWMFEEFMEAQQGALPTVREQSVGRTGSSHF
jgi:asparagine synthase (glutamine-hydrolysing)